MSDKRFEKWNDYSCKVKDNQYDYNYRIVAEKKKRSGGG